MNKPPASTGITEGLRRIIVERDNTILELNETLEAEKCNHDHTHMKCSLLKTGYIEMAARINKMERAARKLARKVSTEMDRLEFTIAEQAREIKHQKSHIQLLHTRCDAGIAGRKKAKRERQGK